MVSVSVSVWLPNLLGLPLPSTSESEPSVQKCDMFIQDSKPKRSKPSRSQWLIRKMLQTRCLVRHCHHHWQRCQEPWLWHHSASRNWCQSKDSAKWFLYYKSTRRFFAATSIILKQACTRASQFSKPYNWQEKFQTWRGKTVSVLSKTIVSTVCYMYTISCMWLYMDIRYNHAEW